MGAKHVVQMVRSNRDEVGGNNGWSDTLVMTGCSSARKPGMEGEPTYAEARSLVTADLLPGRRVVLLTISTIYFNEAGVEEERVVWPSSSCHVDEGPIRLSQGDKYGYEAEARTEGKTIVVTYRFTEKSQVTNEGRLTMRLGERSDGANSKNPAVPPPASSAK